MKLTSRSFCEGAQIPGDFAFAVIEPRAHAALGENLNPHLAWDDVPRDAQSFALICHDPDAPSRGDDVNQEDREVPASLPRVDFFHWLLFDIPAATREIAAGSQSNRVTPRGKPGPAAPGGLRHGINDYTKWFATDAQMVGTYYGYDGPCPPWNDALRHRYIFTLHALDVRRLDTHGDFAGSCIRAALAGHVLAEAKLTGLYTLNPRLVGVAAGNRDERDQAPRATH